MQPIDIIVTHLNEQIEKGNTAYVRTFILPFTVTNDIDLASYSPFRFGSCGQSVDFSLSALGVLNAAWGGEEVIVAQLDEQAIQKFFVGQLVKDGDTMKIVPRDN